MTLISLVLSIAIVGFLVWLILQIPMPAPFQKIIIAVTCVALLIYILQSFGIETGIFHIKLR